MSYFQILLSYLASFLLFFFAPSIKILVGVAASEINQGFSRTVLNKFTLYRRWSKININDLAGISGGAS